MHHQPTEFRLGSQVRNFLSIERLRTSRGILSTEMKLLNWHETDHQTMGINPQQRK